MLIREQAKNRNRDSTLKCDTRGELHCTWRGVIGRSSAKAKDGRPILSDEDLFNDAECWKGAGRLQMRVAIARHIGNKLLWGGVWPFQFNGSATVLLCVSSPFLFFLPLVSLSWHKESCISILGGSWNGVAALRVTTSCIGNVKDVMRKGRSVERGLHVVQPAIQVR
jgi:hypothetical protein